MTTPFHIVVDDPRWVEGTRVIVGSRAVPVRVLADFASAGDSPEFLAGMYDLPVEAVEAAIEYCAAEEAAAEEAFKKARKRHTDHLAMCPFCWGRITHRVTSPPRDDTSGEGAWCPGRRQLKQERDAALRRWLVARINPPVPS